MKQYICNGGSKIKSAFVVFTKTFLKNKDCISIKQRRKIAKFINKMSKCLND